MIEETTPYYRRNFACFMGDWISFTVAASLAGSTTVLPAFVSHLTDSPVLIGLISTIASGGWLLPQFLTASRIGHRPRKKPYLVTAAAIGRGGFLLLAILLLVVDRPSPGLALGAFFVAYALFIMSDGVAYLAWFDIMGRTIPIRRRGRLIGTSQFLSALAGMGAGLVVDYVLGGKSSLGFPDNFGTLFGIAAVFFAISFFSITGLKEPPGVEGARPKSIGDYVRSASRVLRNDQDFRRITIFRLLIGLSGVSTPFFVVYATKEVGLGVGVAGVFLIAQVAGSLLASAALSFVSERKGNRVTTIIEGVLTVAAPACALLVALTMSAAPSAFTVAFAVVFALVGAQANSMSLGHMNYLMEAAPPDQRTTYVGLCNTISGLLIAAPLVAGWFLGVTSYEALFALTAVIAVPAVVQSLRLRDPRRAPARS